MRYLLTITFMTIVILFITGCGDGGSSSSRSSSSTIINSLRQENNTLKNKIGQLEKEIDQVKQERDQAKSQARLNYITLSIIAYSALGIGLLLIGGFILLCARRPVSSPQLCDDTCCPRCGWKHAPEETVCRNCKTHF